MGTKGRHLNLVYMIVTHTVDNNINSFMCSTPLDGSQNPLKLYTSISSRFFQFFRKIKRLLFKKYPLKFSKLENQGPFILNEAMPDLMVAFLGWNSNFEKKVRGAYYYYAIMSSWGSKPQEAVRISAF